MILPFYIKFPLLYLTIFTGLLTPYLFIVHLNNTNGHIQKCINPTTCNHDLQLGELLYGKYTSLNYTVNAANNSNGLGYNATFYLTNGYANNKLWFQVGITKVSNKWMFTYSMWNSSNTIIYPNWINTNIISGDTVKLILYTNNKSAYIGYMDMNTTDKNITMIGYNVSYFGGQNDNLGYFTGPMYEEYYYNAITCTYINPIKFKSSVNGSSEGNKTFFNYMNTNANGLYQSNIYYYVNNTFVVHDGIYGIIHNGSFNVRASC